MPLDFIVSGAVIHLKRNLFAKVNHGDKGALAADLRDIFRTGFRRVTRMRTDMPNEESVLTLMGSVAMEHKAFDSQLANITCDRALFPD